MKILVIGSGGHAGVVLASMAKMHSAYEVVGLVDDFKQRGKTVKGYPVLGATTDLNSLRVGHDVSNLFVAIGDWKARMKFSQLARHWGYFMPPVVDPAARVRVAGPDISASIGDGAYLSAQSVVQAGSIVYPYAIVNTGAILEHDSTLGAYSHLCPGAVTGGRVTIGDHTFIGVGAMIRDGVKIGTNTVIGMGSVVTKDIPDDVVAYGNPCEVIRENR